MSGCLLHIKKTNTRKEKYMTPEDVATNVSSMHVKEGFIGTTNFTYTYGIETRVDDANQWGN